MNTFILILIGLNIGVPVRCYEDPQDWKENKIEVGAIYNAVAYYNSGEEYIALGPTACYNVRRPTIYGAFILGHELTHVMQDRNGTPFDEEEADSNAKRFSLGWLHKLERYFKREAAPLVILGP